MKNSVFCMKSVNVLEKRTKKRQLKLRVRKHLHLRKRILKRAAKVLLRRNPNYFRPQRKKLLSNCQSQSSMLTPTLLNS